MDRERLIRTVHRGNSIILNGYFDDVSDDELKYETQQLVIDLLKTLDYYELKSFRITLMNTGLFHSL